MFEFRFFNSALLETQHGTLSVEEELPPLLALPAACRATLLAFEVTAGPVLWAGCAPGVVLVPTVLVAELLC